MKGGVRMKKSILLILIAFFAFTTSASANTEQWSATVFQSGNQTLSVDIWSYYNGHATITVYAKGANNQLTEVYSNSISLNQSSYTTHRFNVGYLPVGDYVVKAEFSTLGLLDGAYFFVQP